MARRRKTAFVRIQRACTIESPRSQEQLEHRELRRDFGVTGGLAGGLAVAYSVVYLILLYSAVVWGFVVVRRRDSGWAPLVFLGGVGVYLLVVAAGPEAYGRFRVPVLPLLAVFAGIGWDAGRAAMWAPGPRPATGAAEIQ